MITGTSQFAEHLIMASNGTESEDGTPAWIVVDDADAMLAGAEFRDGDAIEYGVRRLADAGAIPAGAHAIRGERVASPYPWQPRDYQYRWTAA